MHRVVRLAAATGLVIASLLMTSCNTRVGVGVGVGIPVGNNGYVTVGASRW
jgi:predicted small secreted protein